MSDKNLFRRASERLGFRSSISRMNSPPVVVNTSQSEPSGEEWVDEEGEGGQRATSNRSSRHAQRQSRTHQVHHPTHAIQRHSQQSRHTHALPPQVSAAPQLSPNSSPGFPDSLIYASDFMLGVGMVILQPSTGKCAVVYDSKQSYWLLPKGRKDAHESLETAVLREAYEESGYRAQLLPLYIPTNCPTPRGQPPAYDTLTTEPIYVSTYHWSKIRPPQTRDCTGGEYLTFWYVGWIPEDAVWQPGTGVEFEEGYRSYLLTREEALDRLNDYEVAKTVLSKAYELLDIKNRYEASMAQRLEQQRRGESLQGAPPA